MEGITLHEEFTKNKTTNCKNANKYKTYKRP